MGMPWKGRPYPINKTLSICRPDVQLKELNHVVAIIDVHPYA